jgi:hypothetical protein
MRSKGENGYVAHKIKQMTVDLVARSFTDYGRSSTSG